MLKILVVCYGSALSRVGDGESQLTVVTNIKKTRYLLLAAFWVLLLNVSVRALDPNSPASSFLRTHFTTDDGLPGAVAFGLI
jgi:hypothetical protein